MTFGQRIKNRRIDLGLSQRDVSVMIDSYNVSVSQWELDHTYPSLINFFNLMIALKMEISETALKEYLEL